MMNYQHKYYKYKVKYLQYKNNNNNNNKAQAISKNYNKNKLKDIIHPINGPKEVIVVLKPFLIYDGSQNTESHLTGIQNIDDIITERISVDKTDLKNVLPFYYQSAYYWYDSGLDEKDLLEEDVEIEVFDYKFNNGLIFLSIRKSNNNGFNKADYRAIKICFDPYNFGPDGYMLQDITIYEGEELKPYLDPLRGEHKVVIPANIQALIDSYGITDEPEYYVEIAVHVIDILPHLNNQ